MKIDIISKKIYDLVEKRIFVYFKHFLKDFDD
jgi:hypothetical protein